MDLQISVFILFILFTAGHSLSCYECMGLTGSCADQKLKTCPSGSSQCLSLTSARQDQIFKLKAKDCVVDCQSGFMNVGISKMSSFCCNTDQCNVQDAPDPPNTPNGKKCYYCDGQTCSNTVRCSGTEDRCVKATVTVGSVSAVVKGCASKSICNTTFIPSLDGISCCEGNLCNGSQSVTQSVLFLCGSLLSYFLLMH